MLEGNIGGHRNNDNCNTQQPMPWDGFSERRRLDGQPNSQGSGDWFQYKYLFLEKFNGLERKVNDIEETVDEIKISFVKLQTKILVVSGMSGVISAALMAGVFTALADKFIK